MTAERDALADEQAYGIASKVMSGWPVPTIGMYAALVRAGYRAALAAPAQETTHITWDAQGRRLVNGELGAEHAAPAQGEPQDYDALIEILRARDLSIAEFHAMQFRCADAIAALREENAALQKKCTEKELIVAGIQMGDDAYVDATTERADAPRPSATPTTKNSSPNAASTTKRRNNDARPRPSGTRCA